MMSSKNLFYYIIKIIRPYQWVKNILIFVPILLSQNINFEIIILAIKAFIIFSFTSSSIYVINDIVDIKSDQSHPFKKNRPLAAGLISINQCKTLIIFLLLLCAVFLLDVNTNFLLLIISYFVTANLYTLIFKKIFFIDLLILSLLYTLRIIGGGIVIDISITNWLLFFSLFFFISLASIKRQIELISAEKFKRKEISGRGYKVTDKKIIHFISVSSGFISILILIFYINSSEIIKLYSYPEILWIVCLIILFWVSRLIVKSNKGEIEDDPLMYALKDKISYICLLSISCIMFLAITI